MPFCINCGQENPDVAKFCLACGTPIATAPTAAAPPPPVETRSEERRLVTAVFTDIVGSTKQAAELGDRRWRALLDQHDGMVRRQLERFRGRYVKNTGDGALITFDGPARAIDCSLAIRDGARQLGLEERVGLHSGEVETLGNDFFRPD